MENKEISLQTVLDVMNSKFEKIDKRLDGIDSRLDNMDIRITRMDADNKEAHEKILEELQKQGNTLTRLETEFGDKIAILFVIFFSYVFIDK